jgi:arylsulfatase
MIETMGIYRFRTILLSALKRLLPIAFGISILIFINWNGKQMNHNPKSVLLITIDTLRADHLSSYGYFRQTSPNLDTFMARGTRFVWAFSPSSCTAPSHASIFTGLYPSFHSIGVYNGRFSLQQRVTTLAELCLNRGMHTAAIISNPVLKKKLGLNQGFQSYDDNLQEEELNRRIYEQYAAEAVDKAIAKVEELRSVPFFLWVHFQDPHGPYNPPDKLANLFMTNEDSYQDDVRLELGKDNSGYHSIPAYQAFGDERYYSQYVNRYDGEIAYLDRQLGRLFHILDRYKLLNNTLVVITADHGEAMGEDGFYFGHSHSVGLDQVRVPLAFVGPGIIGEGHTVQEPVSTLDIYATILEFLHIPLPEEVQSKSLFKFLKGKKASPGHPVYTESFSQIGVVWGGLYLRRDRYTPMEKEVWDTGNPNTGGILIPLGEQIKKLKINQGIKKVVDRQKLSDILCRFKEKTEKSQKIIQSTSKEKKPSSQELEVLKSLGYI